ncbi:MAG: HD domain-containing protein [Firmicutes bacterium]|nr:HD domain-containing protein [Bacillota bacterium]
MLTGQADFNVAVDAINKGYIFRFLVKPCLPEVFLESLNEAINKNRQYQEQVDELKKEWSLELIRKTAEDTIKLIESLLEKRDPYTAGHQSRVAELAVAISREIGLPEEKMEGLKIASLIHDIGKAFVPAEILNKAGKLSEIEFSLIKTHPQAGYDVIKDIDFPWPIADIILQHHERLNGSGYPYGKIGNDIILEARILAVADVIEAMSLHRPYRPPLGTEKALLEITLNKGILYDPDVADACLKVFEKGFSFS